MTLVWRPGFQFDADASTYIEAVEAADTQALETGVRYAINDFVIGCKNDGIWSAVKASCILTGARTLDGALVPLVGAAPTNYNFVAGDYNRKTGLKGNGSNKVLGSNYLCSIASADSTHTSVFVSELVIDGTTQILVGGYMGSALNAFEIQQFTTGALSGFVRASWPFSGPIISTGLSAAQRNSSTSVQLRTGNQLYSSTSSKAAGTLGDIRPGIFARENYASGSNVFNFYAKSRIAFYSIGESLDLALLDARVTALVTAIGAAIP